MPCDDSYGIGTADAEEAVCRRLVRRFRGGCSRLFTISFFSYWAIAGLCAIIVGVGAGRLLLRPFPPVSSPPSVYVYDGVKVERQVEGQQYDKFVEAWKIEVARRFPDALLFVCHGSTGFDITTGEKGWYLFPEAQGRIPVRVDVALRGIKVANPGRTIVLLSCNPDHFRLTGLSNVYYALDAIWLWPDKNVEDTSRIRAEPRVVGNIFEFVSAS